MIDHGAMEFHRFHQNESYWIMVIAPMDSGFVGPFESRDAAEQWAGQHECDSIDCVIMTEFEMRDNIAKYGEPDYITNL